MKVIGAGFGRTGTLSLQSALEQLGFKKCYHMVEVFKHPDHPALWSDAAEGRPVDWDSLLDGYEATVDWPGCTFYKELMAQYPDAKVLLSVRDFEGWYKSVRETIYEISNGFPMKQTMKIALFFRKPGKMASSIVWKNTFQDRFLDKDFARQVFEAHIAEVKRVVPPDRLLVYQVREGWGPLCAFLGVPVPENTPFPHLNDTAVFRSRIRTIRIMASAMVVGPVLLLAALAWYLLG